MMNGRDRDVMPDILDGRNVSDFFDPDILQRLEELEREEGLVLEQEVGDSSVMNLIISFEN